MSAEKEENYVWVLSRLKETLVEEPKVIFTDRDLVLMGAVASVFPLSKHMLCREHIRRNIEDRVKKNMGAATTKAFVREALHLFDSATELDYEQRLSAMREKWKHHWGLIRYLEMNWLDPYKDRIIACWTHQYTVFGNTTTNRYVYASCILMSCYI